MTQKPEIESTLPCEGETLSEPLAQAVEDALPPFNLPPLPKTRRAEIRVPASVNGRDLSQGQP